MGEAAGAAAGRVEFHHGVGDKLAYACRLLRKAYRSGARVVVTGQASQLKELDRQLWTFDEPDFLPHILVGEAPVAPRLHDTPVWLTTQPASAPGHPAVLVNLGDVLPDGLDHFQRLFEVVSLQPDDRQRGRQRWRAYEAMGWEVHPHEVQE
jgi:DNA polymerase-3 subunit chi